MISNLDFYNPVRLVGGPGCLKNYTGWRNFGRRCIIICGKRSARASGALADCEQGLKSAGVDYIIFDRIEPNPLLSTCFESGKKASIFGAEFVIGIGGGSPLDAAKACAMFALNPDLAPIDIFAKSAELSALPIIAVPTTAGTGSEVTPYSILTVPEIENKRSFSSEKTYPKVAFLDPAYTYSLPDAVTASCTADALSHAVEGYFSLKANTLTDALAEKATVLLSGGLRRIAAGDKTPGFRADMLYGSTLSGMVISRTGTGFVHACGYMLTYHQGIPHGHANAYFLADFVGLMAEKSPERAKNILSACGVDAPQGLHELLAQVLPLDFQADAGTLKKYAAVAAASKNCKNTLRTVDEAELLSVYTKNCGVR